ncbi:MAG TPA: alanine racemase [Nocardioides sp.]|uniref:alanine racemase n=1 Tax=Nocardioides sp. TaxID=35761 RepID=UPI002D80C4AD|nr:alanine racemase [Nocardioides sp.]HET6651939.1 alanine racemase [Nocardioides sp.]
MSANLHDLPTPTLLVDVDVLQRNIEDMAAYADRAGLALRPHAKTHKSPAVAALQRAAGATGLSVATVSEAEVFADAGHTDLFIAYPLWLDHDRATRVRALLQRATLTLGVDSADAARRLAAQLAADAAGIRTLVEVDSGHHRSGVPPEEAGLVADAARHAGLEVGGVFTFPGHSYSPAAQAAVAAEEADALKRAAASLRDVGVEPTVVSGGSTPSVAHTHADAMTELRPGVYVFGDAQQWELGTTTPDRIALTAWSTVVSHAGGRVVLDAGSKVIGADRPAWATGHGRLLDHPGARIVLLSEHHAVVEWDEGPVPELGSRLRVVPNHVCNAVNLVDELVAVHDGVVVERWPVAARGANT